ncbi:unnamed protein product, partial [Timema podura]|nr:unnamed protein product [Timema podura]
MLAYGIRQDIHLDSVREALMKIPSCEAIPSIKEFFPSIKNDLTKVTWIQNVFNDETFKWAIE